MSSISVQAYTLREKMKTPDDARKTLRALSDLGLEWIQPSVPAFWTAREFARELKQVGLQADSFSCLERDLLAKRDELLRTAEALAIRKIRAGMLSRQEVCSVESVTAYAREAERQAAALRQDGLTVIYHFHDWEFCRLGEQTALDILYREAPTLTYQPDVHWLAAAGYTPQDRLRGFAGRFEYVHMQDYAMLPDGKGGVSRMTVPVGQGNLDCRAIVNTCRALGVRMYVIEQDYCQKDELESVADSVNALHALGIQ